MLMVGVWFTSPPWTRRWSTPFVRSSALVCAGHCLMCPFSSSLSRVGPSTHIRIDEVLVSRGPGGRYFTPSIRTSMVCAGRGERLRWCIELAALRVDMWGNLDSPPRTACPLVRSARRARCCRRQLCKHAGGCCLTSFSSSLLASNLHPLLPHHSLLSLHSYLTLRGPSRASNVGQLTDLRGAVDAVAMGRFAGSLSLHGARVWLGGESESFENGRTWW